VIARRQRGWIGIDLGTQVVKIAQLERAGGRLRWSRTALERPEHPREAKGGETPQWPIDSGPQIVDALRRQGGFHGRAAACALPMSLTELRTLVLPPGDESEHRAMIAQELEAVSGANDEPREFDFWEADADAQREAIVQNAVHVMSIARSLVARLGVGFARAGLECRVLDGLPCALARAVTLAQRSQRPEPVAAIDWGVANATFCVVQGGRTQFIRTLRDCGAGALVAQVAQSLGLSPLEAGDVLRRFGLPEPCGATPGNDGIQEVVADVLAGHLRIVLEELAKTLSYLRAQRSVLLPARLWLFGGGAAIKNVAAFLAAKLEIPCDVWRLPGEEEPGGGQSSISSELFGPAAALSALAWMS
jgi:type IV pilus assembly protein PilM